MSFSTPYTALEIAVANSFIVILLFGLNSPLSFNSKILASRRVSISFVPQWFRESFAPGSIAVSKLATDVFVLINSFFKLKSSDCLVGTLTSINALCSIVAHSAFVSTSDGLYFPKLPLIIPNSLKFSIEVL